MARAGREARRAVRARHDSVLELLDEAGRPREGALRLVDVSSTGASFTTTLVLTKGDLLRGRLRLLGAGVLEVVARVVRVKERTNCALYGVEFESVKAPRSSVRRAGPTAP